MIGLETTWFFLIGLLFTVYAVLDGFDLGVGFWYLFAREQRDRRALLRAIGPFWDGNEVWLLTGGGALFAAFPHAYATVFSGFYLAMMLVVFGLIFRAVAIEVRDRETSARWRAGWDRAFAAGSIVPALLLGVAIGNILRGVPLDASMDFSGSFFGLLNPYALLIGLVGFSMLATHGALYLAWRLRGDLQRRARGWAQKAWVAYLALFVLTSPVTLTTQGHLLRNYRAIPALWGLPILAVVLIAALGYFNHRGRAGSAFAVSCVAIVTVMAKTAAALYPRLVPALGRPELSLTISNASSSALTLKTMLILAAIGMPVVIAYTLWAYRTFARPVDAEEGPY
jgi:cytochrome d ubiquinol oxidase subunit II